MAAKTASTTDALRILRRRYYEGKPERLGSLENERLNARIARGIFELRTSAGLTQRELAECVGTQASLICRLEDADYGGHSLSMLQKIAAALGQRVEIRFVPVSSTPSRLHAGEKKGRALKSRRAPPKGK